MRSIYRNRFATTAIMSSILALAVAAFSTVHASAPQDTLRGSKMEDVRQAMDHLQKAQSLLSKADHDEKGWDYQALKKTEEAIDLCKKQLGIKD